MAVMGRNLALNIESRGYTVAIFNRSKEKTEDVIASHPDKKFVPSYDIASFVNSIEKPRRIMLMVQAGPGTDATIQNLLPHLDKGDILIDGGNTFYKDTERRNAELANSGINFIGTGVSGGEKGALEGPSIMKIIVSGGGTGGHIYPALSFINYLKTVEPDVSVLYIGTEKGLEAKIVPENGIDFKTIDIQGFKRSLSPENVRTVYKFIKSVSDAKKMIKDFKPDVVIGTGGYVAGPVIYAAAKLKIPTIVHDLSVVHFISDRDRKSVV